MAINRKLGRTTDQRLAILKGLATDLVLHGKIETTEARAKEVKSIVDSLIALAVKEKDNTIGVLSLSDILNYTNNKNIISTYKTIFYIHDNEHSTVAEIDEFYL